MAGAECWPNMRHGHPQNTQPRTPDATRKHPSDAKAWFSARHKNVVQRVFRMPPFTSSMHLKVFTAHARSLRLRLKHLTRGGLLPSLRMASSGLHIPEPWANASKRARGAGPPRGPAPTPGPTQFPAKPSGIRAHPAGSTTVPLPETMHAFTPGPLHSARRSLNVHCRPGSSSSPDPRTGPLACSP